MQKKNVIKNGKMFIKGFLNRSEKTGQQDEVRSHTLQWDMEREPTWTCRIIAKAWIKSNHSSSALRSGVLCGWAFLCNDSRSLLAVSS